MNYTRISATALSAFWVLSFATVECLMIVVYSVLASAGYATFGDLVQPNVLHSYPAGSLLVAVAEFLFASWFAFARDRDAGPRASKL